MELDRGYIVNGDDLRIALAEMNGKPFAPRDAAGQILSQIGQPLDEHRAFITQTQLTGRLDRFRLTVIDSQGGSPVNGEVDDPRAVAGEIFAAHAASLAHREPQPDSDPWAPGTVVDAHIHCDHAPVSLASGELAALDKIAELLRPYPQRTVKRVLAWATDYLTDFDNPPF